MEDILTISKRYLDKKYLGDENIWESVVIDRDELIGRESDLFFRVNCGNGSFGFFQKKGMFFIHVIDSHDIFNADCDGSRRLSIPNVIIGFYDKDKNLVNSLKTNKIRCHSIGDGILFSYAYCKDKKVSSKVIEYIKNGDGSVRFIIPRYHNEVFDMTVNCASDFKTTI